MTTNVSPYVAEAHRRAFFSKTMADLIGCAGPLIINCYRTEGDGLALDEYRGPNARHDARQSLKEYQWDRDMGMRTLGEYTGTLIITDGVAKTEWWGLI